MSSSPPWMVRGPRRIVVPENRFVPEKKKFLGEKGNAFQALAEKEKEQEKEEESKREASEREKEREKEPNEGQESKEMDTSGVNRSDDQGTGKFGVLGANVYVQNIPRRWTKYELRQTFKSYGPIASLHVMMDPVTKRNKGIGFVCYETHEAAEAALRNMHGHALGPDNEGKQLTVMVKSSEVKHCPPSLRALDSKIRDQIQQQAIQTALVKRQALEKQTADEVSAPAESCSRTVSNSLWASSSETAADSSQQNPFPALSLSLSDPPASRLSDTAPPPSRTTETQTAVVQTTFQAQQTQQEVHSVYTQAGGGLTLVSVSTQTEPMQEQPTSHAARPGYQPIVPPVNPNPLQPKQPQQQPIELRAALDPNLQPPPYESPSHQSVQHHHLPHSQRPLNSNPTPSTATPHQQNYRPTTDPTLDHNPFPPIAPPVNTTALSQHQFPPSAPANVRKPPTHNPFPPVPATTPNSFNASHTMPNGPPAAASPPDPFPPYPVQQSNVGARQALPKEPQAQAPPQDILPAYPAPVQSKDQALPPYRYYNEGGAPLSGQPGVLLGAPPRSIDAQHHQQQQQQQGVPTIPSHLYPHTTTEQLAAFSDRGSAAVALQPFDRPVTQPPQRPPGALHSTHFVLQARQEEDILYAPSRPTMPPPMEPSMALASATPSEGQVHGAPQYSNAFPPPAAHRFDPRTTAPQGHLPLPAPEPSPSPLQQQGAVQKLPPMGSIDSHATGVPPYSAAPPADVQQPMHSMNPPSNPPRPQPGSAFSQQQVPPNDSLGGPPQYSHSHYSSQPPPQYSQPTGSSVHLQQSAPQALPPNALQSHTQAHHHYTHNEVPPLPYKQPDPVRGHLHPLHPTVPPASTHASTAVSAAFPPGPSTAMGGGGGGSRLPPHPHEQPPPRRLQQDDAAAFPRRATEQGPQQQASVERGGGGVE